MMRATYEGLSGCGEMVYATRDVPDGTRPQNTVREAGVRCELVSFGAASLAPAVGIDWQAEIRGIFEAARP